MGLHRVTGVYKRLRGLQGVTWDEKGLQGLRRG